MSEKKPIDAPLNHNELGLWSNSCGPKGKSSTVTQVICLGAIIAGIFGSLAGVIVTPKPGNEFMSPVFLYGGMIFSLLGVAGLFLPFFTVTPKVDLYASGILFKDKKVVASIPWHKISKAVINTIYDTRFSSFRTAILSVDGIGHINFDTQTEGEPDLIIEAIIKNVANIEYKEISLG